jgi:uncharacterized protein (TIRG00374 family)
MNYNNLMRKLIIGLVLLIAIIFIITHFAEVEKINATLQRADWRFLVIAVICQGLWYGSVGAAYKFIYRGLGLEVSHMRLLRLAIASDFVGIIIPSGGFSGISVFINDARLRGQSPIRAAVAGMIMTLFDYIAFLCILVLGIIVLIRRSNLHWGEITAASVFFLIALGLGTLLYLGARSAHLLAKALKWLAHHINRLLWIFSRRDIISEDQAASFAYDAAEGIQIMRSDPRHMAVPLAFSFCSKLLLMCILIISFLAFKVPFSVGTIIAGFSTGYLFMVISPTPSGIGVFEGALTLALNSLWVSLADAAVITLTYRAVTFWLPLAIGFPVFRSLNKIQQTIRPS